MPTSESQSGTGRFSGDSATIKPGKPELPPHILEAIRKRKDAGEPVGVKAVSDVDTVPPKSVQDNARRALEVRAEKPESQRGMTEVGIARARDLSNGKSLSEETIRRMVAYFERHQSDKQGESWDEQGPGWQAWMGWGGDEGWSWAKRKRDEFDRQRDGKKSCGCCRTKSVRASDLWLKSAEDAQEEYDEITEDENKIASAVDRVLQRQVEAVIRKLNASSAPTAELTLEVEALLKSARWDKEIVAVMRPYLQRSLQAGIQIGTDTIKQLAKAVPDFAPVQAGLASYVETESTRLSRGLATSVNRYTAVRVRDLLGDGIQSGETIPQLAERVREWAGEKGDAQRATRSRALMIARTEANRAARKAEVEAWHSTGLVEAKTWLLAPDPCEFCEAAAAQFGQKGVGVNEPFYARGTVLTGADGSEMTLDYEAIDGPPLHPNCRCSLQPQLVDDYETIIRDMEKELDTQTGPWEEA